MKCIVCNRETTGSIGTTGLHWKNVCQSCKDHEDMTLEERVTATHKAFDSLMKDLIREVIHERNRPNK